MKNSLVNSIVLLGDGIYADIATCYLAVQLKPYNISICRVMSGLSDGLQTICADHSIHAFHQDLGLEFNQLMQKKVLTPQLVSSQSIGVSIAYLESYPYLKDDLPLPYYQSMMKLIKAGVATEYESASPLVALHKAGKFHSQLHRFYRGDVRPYGVSVDVIEYSRLLNEIAASNAVDFIHATDFEMKVSGGFIQTLEIQGQPSINNAFFIDLSKDQKWMSCLEPKNNDSVREVFWSGNCLSLNALLICMRQPANLFEWLFRALVRFVDFFPDTNRQPALASEYNRLQLQDCNTVSDFLMLYDWLNSGKKEKVLPEAIEHSVNLFVESCQFSQGNIDPAYASYWAPMLIAAGLSPKQLPRRVEEIPLQHLKKWYYQRQQNINYLLQQSQ